MAQRIELSADLRNELMNFDSMPRSVFVRGKEFFLQRPIKAGYKGAVWQTADEYGRFRAVKFAIYDDYEDRSFIQELYRAAKLEPYSQFARFDDADIVDVDIAQVGLTRFVCFVEEWIEGYTLEDFVSECSEHVTCSFLKQYVHEICKALSALKTVRLRHDDLHEKNVMLQRPIEGALSDQWTVKVIDMGSLKPSEKPLTKALDDHGHFIEHVVLIYNEIVRKKLLSARDQRFLRECYTLIGSMLDDDKTMALIDPQQIDAQFDYAEARADSPRTDQIPKLYSPFEYISAEHIADDRLLVQIFAESCPWLEKVTGPDPCLLTGPRGCGKSTIFRWLSLRAHLHKEKLDFEELRIAGFYISCSSDLQNRVGWINTAALAKRFRREIVHYFNLLVAREIVQTLSLIERRSDSKTFWGLGKQQSNAVNRFIQTSLNSDHPTLQGVSRLRQALELIEIEMFRCHVQMLKGLNLEWAIPESFLGDFTSLLVDLIPFFKSHRIAFLIDDFSSHRLPEPVQIELNRVIWERRDTHIFKLSSEKYGAVLTDSHSATADVTREMLEVDCGREYVALDDSEQRAKAQRFATELLANRLTVAGYDGTPQELIGSSSWTEGSLGRALSRKREGRKDDQYHGLECIADLCSGDISTLLLVYRRIFEEAGVVKNTTQRIKRRTQHHAIESVSRELFEAIRHHHPFGPEMHSMVNAFGNLVRKILIEGRPVKHGNDYVPPQCPRIEVDQGKDASHESLTPDLEKLTKEVVRRAVFIEMEPGRSRHRVLTLRWNIRRVYLPTFGAALSKNDAVKWYPSNFKFFLTDPESACDLEWQKRQKETSSAPHIDRRQRSLPGTFEVIE